MIKSNLTAILSVAIIVLFFITGLAFGEDALNVSETGRVGVGTITPGARLDIADNGYTGSVLFNIKSDDTGPWSLNLRQDTAAQDWGMYIDNSDNLHLYDRTDSRDVMIWDGSGNVGLGTSSPTQKLDVRGAIRQVMNSNYDLWIQGGASTASGDDRNLAILGIDEDYGDTLYINYASEYANGTVIGGPATISSVVFTPAVGNYYDSNNYTKLYLTASSTTPEANLYAQTNGTSNYAFIKVRTDYGAYLTLRSYNSGSNDEMINLYGDSFYPGNNHGTDLGTSAKAWDEAYARNWHNVADLSIMDDMDDLAVLHAIKGSGTRDPITGFELIDDNTLDERILSKYEEDTPIYPQFDEDSGIPEGFIQRYHSKGEIQRTDDGRPYFTNLSMFSLLIGAIKQLDNKYEAHIDEYNALQSQVEKQQAQIEQLKSELEALKGNK